MNNQAIEMFQNTITRKDNAIWIKPVCDFFNINYKWQLKVIRNDHILASMVEKNANYSLFGDKRKRVLLSDVGFLRWIQIINPTTVKEELQDKFKQYQKLVFDFLFGSVEKTQKAKMLYARLTKLKRLKKNINSEIRSVQDRLETHWNQRYLQGKLQFKSLDNYQ